MKWIALSYLILGVIAVHHVMRKGKKSGVVSVTEDAMSANFIFPILIWPVFVLNDHLLELPKKIKEKEELVEFDALQRDLEEKKEKEIKDFVGKTGTAITDLKSSGKAIIEGKEILVTSIEGFLSKGTEIEVVDHTPFDTKVKIYQNKTAERNAE